MPKKPQLRTIPSDDCVVVIDDIKYNPHEGEWIKTRPSLAVGDIDRLSQFYTTANEMGALENPSSMEHIGKLNTLFDDACAILAGHIVEWNWTNDVDEPLPQPYKSPASIKQLNSEEVFYLLNVVLNGTTRTEEKNSGAPSPTTT